MKYNYTFEEYLRDKFAAQYVGTDDCMPDCEADWFSDLDPDDVIRWAQEWHDKWIKKFHPYSAVEVPKQLEGERE